MFFWFIIKVRSRPRTQKNNPWSILRYRLLTTISAWRPKQESAFDQLPQYFSGRNNLEPEQNTPGQTKWISGYLTANRSVKLDHRAHDLIPGNAWAIEEIFSCPARRHPGFQYIYLFCLDRFFFLFLKSIFPPKKMIWFTLCETKLWPGRTELKCFSNYKYTVGVWCETHKYA